MPVERSDKSIREKIEGLDSLPAGFQLLQSADWKQIEQKLHPAKRKGFALQYAAAAVLFLIAGIFLWNNSSLHAPALPTVAIKENIAPLKQVTPTTNLEKAAAKTASVIPFVKKDHNPVTITELPKTDTVSQSIALITEMPALAPTINNTGSIITVIPKAAAKKRLKVIHANELLNEPEMLYSKNPLKRSQMTEESPDELSPAPNQRSWWQPKPKPVTITTLSDNN